MAAVSGAPSLPCTVSAPARIRPPTRDVLSQRIAASRWKINCPGIRAPANDKMRAAVQAASITGVSPKITDSSINLPSSQKYAGDDYLVKKVSSKEVQELVKSERSVPVIVDFYATWCGPCVQMAQQLEMLAVECESYALFVKVDTDDEYEFARDMQVRGLPTLYIFNPDPRKDAIRIEGLVPPEMIKNIINKQL